MQKFKSLAIAALAAAGFVMTGWAAEGTVKLSEAGSYTGATLKGYASIVVDGDFTVEDSDGFTADNVFTVNSGCTLTMKNTISGNRVWNIAGEEGAAIKPIVIINAQSGFGLDTGSKLRNVKVQATTENSSGLWLEKRASGDALTDSTVDLEIASGMNVHIGRDTTLPSTTLVTIGALTNNGTLSNGYAAILEITTNSTATSTASFSCPIQLSGTATLTVPTDKNPTVKAPAGKAVETTTVDSTKVYSLRDAHTVTWSSADTAWDASTTFDYNGQSVTILEGDTVEFTSNTIVYVNKGFSMPLTIKVDAGKTLMMGHDYYDWNNNKNIPDGSVIMMEEGAKVLFGYWHNTTPGFAIIGNVTINGGSFGIDREGSTSYMSFGNTSGTSKFEFNDGDPQPIFGGTFENEITGNGTFKLGSLESHNYADSWTGTVEYTNRIDASGNGITFDNYGVSGSTVKFDEGIRFWHNVESGNAPVNVATTIDLEGELYSVGVSPRVYTYAEFTGSGNMYWRSDNEPTSFTITKLTDYTGIITNTMSTAIAITTLALPEGTPTRAGTLLLKKSGNVTVSNVTIGGEPLVKHLEYKDDGVYIKNEAFIINIR